MRFDKKLLELPFAELHRRLLLRTGELYKETSLDLSDSEYTDFVEDLFGRLEQGEENARIYLEHISRELLLRAAKTDDDYPNWSERLVDIQPFPNRGPSYRELRNNHCAAALAPFRSIGGTDHNFASIWLFDRRSHTENPDSPDLTFADGGPSPTDQHKSDSYEWFYIRSSPAPAPPVEGRSHTLAKRLCFEVLGMGTRSPNSHLIGILANRWMVSGEVKNLGNEITPVTGWQSKVKALYGSRKLMITPSKAEPPCSDQKCVVVQTVDQALDSLSRKRRRQRTIKIASDKRQSIPLPTERAKSNRNTRLQIAATVFGLLVLVVFLKQTDLSRKLFPVQTTAPSTHTNATDQIINDLGRAVEQTNPESATQTEPFINHLKMRLIPINGLDILIAEFETRNSDYIKYVNEVAKSGTEVNRDWKTSKHTGSNFPVTKVNLWDASDFCDWLTNSERENQVIGENHRYRLPTTDEWRFAMAEPGTEAPPIRPHPFPEIGERIPGTEDNSRSFPYFEEVGKFKPNSYGLYDLGSNVSELPIDFRNQRLIPKNKKIGKLAPYYGNSKPADRLGNTGFRIVLDLGSSAVGNR